MWYSVKDKLPNPNVNCLTYSPNVNGIYRILSTYNGRFFSDVTHWMYLPKVPVIENELVDISNDDTLIEIEEWLDACHSGIFIDYDGYGCFAYEKQKSIIQVWPSMIMTDEFKQLRKDFTHIVWYNR
ncbi:MAG: hypothetical protein PHF86_13270 [Candidatus Nanoarchaeia archaeon]|nr:hypothetical protein [Candidatus Nanoarchaeia archaeon]